MNKILIGSIVVILVLALGLSFLSSKEDNAEQLRSTSFKDATFNIEGKLVTLNNGYAETEIAPGSAAKIVTRYFGNEVNADFNNDGTTDTAFLLSQQIGGSGTFYYVVAALKTKEGYFETNSIFIGDRVAPQTTEFSNGEIVVNYADRLPNQPMTTQPTITVSRFFKIIGQKLVESVK